MRGNVRNGVRRRRIGAAAVVAGLLLGAGAGAVRSQEQAGPAAREGTVAAAIDSARASGSTVYLPVLGSTPDTGFMFGAVALRFFYPDHDAPDPRPSVFSPTFVYTARSQMLIYLGVDLVWDANRNELEFVPSYIDFPDSYFGIGRDADPDADEVTYDGRSVAADLRFARAVRGDWRLGLDGRAVRQETGNFSPAGASSLGGLAGTGTSTLVKLGPSLALDSRDNTWSPRRGLWLHGVWRFAGKALGSDYALDEVVVDLRGYRSLGPDLILAGQTLLTRQTGAVPFWALPRLGGDEGLRGYRGALYRDRTCALARAELRRDALWGRLGGVVFAGVGDVAPDPSALTLAGRLWTVGGGLRFMIDTRERVNIRADVGFGNGDAGFFLSLGEAF
ncbi:BamA/TamA family outer membrane protein [bacterium]|nr:BamA/TamA family outer membrane protein [bacterium]